MASELHWLGISEFKAALDHVVSEASAAARNAVAEVAHAIQREAMQNASGRPGPNVGTGTLRRGIVVEPLRPWGLGGWQTRVGPTVKYGRRVELGFTGRDSRGRNYNQAPYPYFEPAYRSGVRRLPEIFAKHWRRALGF